MIISTCIYMLDRSINVGIIATGQIKTQSIYASFIYLSVLVLIYISYELGMPVETAYYLSCVVYTVTLLMRTLILKKLIPSFSLRFYLFKVILPILLITLLISIPLFFIIVLMPQGFLRLVVVFFADLFLGGISAWCIALNTYQRKMLCEKAKMLLSLKKKRT